MQRQPGLSLKDYADVLGWIYATGQPDKSRVERRMKILKEAKLVKKERDRYVLTKGGEAEANRIGAQAEDVPY
jgi:predicted transcriptional regulator